MRKAKKMLSWSAPSLVAVFFLGAAVVCSAQDSRYIGGAGITVFEDSNFRGKVQTFQYDIPDLRSSGLDNKISSLRVGPGEQWEVCENRNYQGRCIVVSGQESDLRRNSWGDRISSLRRAGGGGWNPGNPGGGRPPSWAVGTFNGTDPRNGRVIVLTIANDGNVTANIGGVSSYGTLRGESLTINGAVARVTRSGNGILTTRVDNGEQIPYSRSGGGWNPDPGWGGNKGDVPRWAIGTFYAPSPRGGSISLTISDDGTVTVVFDGATNTPEYGSMYRNQLTFQGATARVERLRNGIRTTRNDNGERIDYYRR